MLLFGLHEAKAPARAGRRKREALRRHASGDARAEDDAKD
jgi:hypothetical protein